MSATDLKPHLGSQASWVARDCAGSFACAAAGPLRDCQWVQGHPFNRRRQSSRQDPRRARFTAIGFRASSCFIPSELVRSRASSCHLGTPEVTPVFALCFEQARRPSDPPLSRSRRPLVLGWLSGCTIDVTTSSRAALLGTNSSLWVVVRVRDLRSCRRGSVRSLGGRTLRSPGRSCKDRPPSAAAVTCVMLPLAQAFFGCNLNPLGCFRWKSIALSLMVGVDNALAAQC